jgi:hypothetical protein
MEQGQKKALRQWAKLTLKAIVQAILIVIIRKIIDHFSSP